MFCGNCGSEIKNVAICNGKCPNCYAPLGAEAKGIFNQEMEEERAEQRTLERTEDKKKKNSFFVDEDEKTVATIGISYVQSYISSSVMGNTSAVLTNKRVYFSGKCFQKSSGHLVKDEREEICELEEIASTGIINIKRVALLWTGAALMLLGVILLMIWRNIMEDIPLLMGGFMIIVAAIMLVIYFVTKGIWYEVSTAGSTIQLRVSQLGGVSAVKLFDREVHRQKESRINRLNNQGADSTK